MVPRMVQGCEVRLCDPCARVRPCVPCVSRLPRCLFTVLYPTYLASENYPKTSCVFGGEVPWYSRCATADFAGRVWGQINAERLRPGQTRPALACCTRINRLTGLVDADGGAAGPVVSSSIIIGD